MDFIYISLEPTHGIYADCYTSACQTLIRHAVDTGRSQCHLGTKCFNATIHFYRTGIPILQRTPSISSKPAGRRSVKAVSCADSEVEVYLIPQFGWSLYQTPNYILKKTVNIKKESGDEVPFWQWCNETDLQKATDLSWMNYCNREQEVIELAFQDNKETINIVVGVTQLSIKFSANSTFHRQIRVLNNGDTRQRWVRRVLLSPASTLEIETHLRSQCNDDTCAICLNDFNEEPLNPTRKLQCEHVFHALCIQMLLDRNENRCPLCRVTI